MFFVRSLELAQLPLGEKCSHAISLPPPIQFERFPDQIAWPWEEKVRNVACPPCKHVFEYLAPNCRWHPVQTPAEMESLRNAAVYLLSVPCEIKRCGHLIDILILGDVGAPPAEDSESVTELFAMGIPCREGHRAAFRIGDRSPRFVTGPIW